ncbi:GntR family transcriptional regulator [Streptomyces sp. NBC_01352]|uniref:GntR family transcriptional regulator n=1 Tax=Streptomyces sp. NBC_01352 TaxID=2903834 RepID=UPI002E2F3BC8|nr:GntR family transcriptional regulator [Streptomyces sp. NBC_01352]
MASIQRRAADLVFDNLHERIVSGALAPGDRVDPTEIAEELGVSRTPVREAILRLDSEGLVNRLPYRGVVVTGIDLRVAEEIAALRIHMETLATRLAVPRLRDSDLVTMREANERLSEAVRGEHPQRSFNELNRRFHMTLYERADSTVLLRTIENLSSQAERIRMHFDLTHSPAHQHHEVILDACERRDPDAAAAATRDHILAIHCLLKPDGYRIEPGSPLAVVLATAGLKLPDGSPALAEAGTDADR